MNTTEWITGFVDFTRYAYFRVYAKKYNATPPLLGR
jgi:hypothetical protein